MKTPNTVNNDIDLHITFVVYRRSPLAQRGRLCDAFNLCNRHMDYLGSPQETLYRIHDCRSR
jgi:hypothetical protein